MKDRLNCLGLLMALAFWGALPQPAAADQPESEAAVGATNVAEEPAASRSTDADARFRVQFGEQEVVRVFGDATVSAGERRREVVTVFGNATIDGDVDGNVVVVWGDAQINGTIGEQLVVVLGNAKLGPKASVRGETVVVGGGLDKAAGAFFGREPLHLSLGPMVDWLKRGLLWGRPIAPSVGWVWGVVGLSFLIYLIIAILLPKPVAACVKTLEDKALPAFFIGLLSLVLIGPLSVVLTASVIGLLIVPFVICAFVAAILVGKTAAFQFIGLRFWPNPDAHPRSLLPFFVGSIVVTVLYMIPALGFILWGILLPLGLGAALMAAFAAYRRNGRGAVGTADTGPVMVPVVPPGTVDALIPAGPAPALSSPLLAEGATAAVSAPAPAPAPAPTAAPADAVAMARAGFWIRFAATFLDFILFVWLIPTTGVFFLFAWLVYHIGMWLWKGTTIGGIVCSLKVVRLNGRPLDFSVALVRALAAVFSLAALGLGFFWAGWSKERQAWHDQIAGTVIVRVPKGISLI